MYMYVYVFYILYIFVYSIHLSSKSLAYWAHQPMDRPPKWQAKVNQKRNLCGVESEICYKTIMQRKSGWWLSHPSEKYD